MENSFAQKKIAIFGGTSGIGKRIALLLLERKANVIIFSKSQQPSSEFEGEFSHHLCDGTNYEQVVNAFKKISDEYGSLDGVVNCIGTIKLKPAHQASIEDWNTCLDLNLNSSFFILKESIPLLSKEGGSLLFMSTAATQVGLANHELVSATKSGVNGLVLSAAATYAKKNIRVNAIGPGLVETPLSESMISNPMFKQASEKLHPLGRLGKDDDIANAALYFLDPQNSWVTGQNLCVDGGLSTIKR
tara:strand:- start:2756 stop:3493 length:738 start_codon:yes stop_codon:yes gene_type:complete